jgi:hypothetical protein
MFLAGCFFGADPLPPSDRPDANLTPDAPPPPPDAPPPNVCKDAKDNQATGEHNPGLDCQAGNCHGPASQNPAAPQWTISGTLYAAPTGATIVKYGIVSIVDADGVKIDLVTAQNGNFYTSAPLKFPVRVYASKCPAIKEMSGSVLQGSCNACHTAASATGQVSLPPQ